MQGKSKFHMAAATAAALLLFVANSAWARLEPAYPKQQNPNCAVPLTDESKFMVSMGDLKITYDQHIYWQDKEVILYQNHSRVANREHKHSVYLFRVLLSLVDAPNVIHKIEDLYEEAWVDKNSDDHEIEMDVPQAVMWIRRSFQLVDERFDRIKRIRSAGFMWEAGDLQPDYVSGEFEAITATRRIFWKKKEIKMTRGQFEMTMLLIKNEDRPQNFDTLYQAYRGTPLLPQNRDKMLNILRTEKTNIVHLFKGVDGTFDSLQSVYGQGMIWRSHH